MQVLLGIYCKRFYWILLFPILLLFYVFEVGQAKSWTHKCPNDINTEWAIPENFSSFSMFLFVFYFFTFVFYFTFKFSCFLLYAWKFHILNPSLLPLFVFFHYSVCTEFLTANILLIQVPLPIQSHKNTLYLKIQIWMEFFEIKNFCFSIKIFQS